MKANKKYILEEDEGVSAVIGVILMVAITVAIAATVYVYVSGMMGEGTRATPVVTFASTPSDRNVTLTIASVGSAGIEWADIGFTLVNRTGATQFSGPWGGAGTLWGAANTITVSQPAGVTTASGGQIIIIRGIGGGTNGLVKGNEYSLTLVYTPTGGTMGSATWIQ